MADIPHNGDILRNRDGRPIVRVWAWVSGRDGGIKTSASCIRENDVPKSATGVAVYFFNAKTRNVFGMDESPPKPSKGSKLISREELKQFTVTC